MTYEKYEEKNTLFKDKQWINKLINIIILMFYFQKILNGDFNHTVFYSLHKI